MKTALITGINGMDGSHLADLLLTKNYKVYKEKKEKPKPPPPRKPRNTSWGVPGGARR